MKDNLFHGMNTLKDRAHFHTIHVPGDGDCLYHSVKYSLVAQDIPLDLRKVCRLYLYLNSSKLNNYKLKKRLCATPPYSVNHWGTDEELVLMSTLFGIDILVFSTGDYGTQLFRQGKVEVLHTGQESLPTLERKTVYIVNEDGQTHFNALAFISR